MNEYERLHRLSLESRNNIRPEQESFFIKWTIRISL